MVLYVLNRNEEVVGTLSNEDLSNPTLLSATVNKKINNMSTLSLTVSKNTDFIKEENFIIYKDTNDEWNLYIIREINEAHSEGFTKDILCEDGSQELLDNLSLYDLGGSTSLPSVLLEKILQGTRWSVGKVDNPTSAAEIKNTKKSQSVLESIYTICDQYGLEAKFTYNVTNNKITKRTVSLLATIGNDRGKRFEYTKDIESIERIVDSTEIRTAVAVYGGVMEEDKDKPSNEQRILDIVNIAWTSNDGLCSTEIGKNYIEIKGATNTWGYVNSDGSKMPRIGRYENNSFTADREGLCDHAYEMLKKHKDPKVTYKIDAVDLYALSGDTDFAHERVGIGDVVRVIDKEFRPYLLIETRIIEITENLLDPSDLKLSLGDKVKSFTDSNALDMDKQISDKVINILQNNVYNGLADLEQKVEDLSGVIEEEDSSPINYNWIKNSDFTNGSKYWHLSSSAELSTISGIPYFIRGIKSTSNNTLMQIVQGGESLLNETVTLSAFVKGISTTKGAELSLNIVYTNNSNVEKSVKLVSAKADLVANEWKRVAFTTKLTKPSDMKDFVRLEVIVKAINTTVETTGVMLNIGSKAAKYIKNPFDKFGQGVWDEVSQVISDNFNNGTGYMYVEEDDGIWVYDRPIDENPSKVTVMKGGQLGIGKWNLNEKKWEVTTFIDGDSVNASCINAGEFNGDLIKVGTIKANRLELATQQVINNAASKEFVTTTIEASVDGITQRVSSSENKLTTVEKKVDGKADSDNVYSKTEVYTKSQTDSAINIAKDSINLGVSQTYETKTNVENKIATAKTELDSKITVKANEINQSVTNKLNDYATTSSLTQTANSITASFNSSGGANLVRNGDFKNGATDWWSGEYQPNSTNKYYELWNDNSEWVLNGTRAIVIRGSWLSTGEQRWDSAKFPVKANTTYTLSFLVASHRTSKVGAYVRGNEWEIIGSHGEDIYGQGYSGGKDRRLWKKFVVTFNSGNNYQASVNLIMFEAQDNGYVWFTEVMVNEGNQPIPYCPHSEELVNGSTVINGRGITVNNGAIRIKNNNGQTVLEGDSNGDLTLNGRVVNGSDVFQTRMERGGLTYRIGDEDVATIRTIRNNSNHYINGLSIAMMPNGDYLDLGYTEGTSFDTSVPFYPSLRISKGSAEAGGFNGVQLYSDMQFRAGKHLYFSDGTECNHEIFASNNNRLTMMGNDGFALGYKEGDTRRSLITGSETDFSTGAKIYVHSGFNMAGNIITNSPSIGNIHKSAIRISNINAYLDSGWYSFDANCVGLPVAKWGILLHIDADYGTDFLQMLFLVDNTMRIRWWVNGAYTVWKTW